MFRREPMFLFLSNDTCVVHVSGRLNSGSTSHVCVPHKSKEALGCFVRASHFTAYAKRTRDTSFRLGHRALTARRCNHLNAENTNHSITTRRVICGWSPLQGIRSRKMPERAHTWTIPRPHQKPHSTPGPMTIIHRIATGAAEDFRVLILSRYTSRVGRHIPKKRGKKNPCSFTSHTQTASRF